MINPNYAKKLESQEQKINSVMEVIELHKFAFLQAKLGCEMKILLEPDSVHGFASALNAVLIALGIDELK